MCLLFVTFSAKSVSVLTSLSGRRAPDTRRADVPRARAAAPPVLHYLDFAVQNDVATKNIPLRGVTSSTYRMLKTSDNSLFEPLPMFPNSPRRVVEPNAFRRGTAPAAGPLSSAICCVEFII
ncbi:hypothetical protein EVAR_23676_1 [Eumeta japonica]|uniref:Uncharacterized protein n=1 Tax=Eumeta variegata TaxID=151549 RepID=A0A4C1VIR1_EUMVA|nr:hypothetical protein EVAR_23676_1 [Eumeta japonica]